MWSALENAALRESLPAPLQAGQTVHGIIVRGQLGPPRHTLNHAGLRHSKQYILKQYYGLDTNAFLRWQNEARWTKLPQQAAFHWPCEEWRGGVIIPIHSGTSLDNWLTKHPSIGDRLRVLSRLASRLASLHASGIAHRAISDSTVLIHGDTVSLTQFGYSRNAMWDDPWADSFMPIRATPYASPAQLAGQPSDTGCDIYAFGILLHRILSHRMPFGPFKTLLRSQFPAVIRPTRLDTSHCSRELGELTHACLAPQAQNRPTMTEVASILGANPASIKPLNFALPQPIRKPKRVMVFIKGDSRTTALFDAIITKAQANPTITLFVALVPCNLPSGHMERFKGRLFRRLAHGLMRCRENNMSWGIRLLEHVDPKQTARALIDQYEPDEILIGGSRQRHGIQRSFNSYISNQYAQTQSIG